MNAAELLVQSIEKLEIPYIFGLPGSTESPILDAFVDDRDVQYVLALHENISVAMADGYGRASGIPGIVNLHTVVGTANGLSQLYNAYRDRSSLLVIAGHKSTSIYNRDGFCTMDDLPGLTRSFTKWSGQSMKSNQITDDFHRAFNRTKTAPHRPVYLSLPEDLLGEEVIDDNLPSIETTEAFSYQPSSELLKEAIVLLRKSSRLVIIAGDQVGQAGATNKLQKLAENLGAVVLREPRRSATCYNYSTIHDHFAGEYFINHPAVQEADCIFAVGCRIFVEFSLPKNPELPLDIPLVHLHDDPMEIGKLYPASVGLVGNTLATLNELLVVFANQCLEQGWATTHRKSYLNTLESEVDKESNNYPLRVTELVSNMGKILPYDSIIVDEGIRSSRPLVRHFPFQTENSYHTTSGGALGWGLPAAIGVQLAQPKRQVVAFVGDGSASFSIQSLWTAAKYQIPVIFIIVNNGGYLAVKAAIQNFGAKGAEQGLYPASKIDNPTVDFVSLANGYGVKGTKADGIEEFNKALRTGLNMDEPFLIDILVDEEKI